MGRLGMGRLGFGPSCPAPVYKTYPITEPNLVASVLILRCESVVILLSVKFLI